MPPHDSLPAVRCAHVVKIYAAATGETQALRGVEVEFSRPAAADGSDGSADDSDDSDDAADDVNDDELDDLADLAEDTDELTTDGRG